MKQSVIGLCAGLFSGCVSFLGVEAKKQADDLKDFSQKAIDPSGDRKGNFMVKYGTEWCGYCKVIAPKYAEVAKLLEGEKANIKVLDIDCDKEKELCQKAGIKGYPTIMFYKDGKATPYNGKRETAEMYAEAKRLLSPITELKDVSEEAIFQERHELSLIGGFSDKASPEYKAFSDYADKNTGGCWFGVLIREGAPQVRLHRKTDDETFVLSEITEEKIKEHFEANKTSMIQEIGPNNYEELMGAPVPLGYLFYSTPGEKKMARQIKDVLKGAKGQLNFVTIDAVSFGGHAEFLSLERKWPAVAIHDKIKKLKYTLQEPTEGNLKKFIEDFLAGKVEPTFKSEKLPESNEGPLKIIARENFKDLALDKGKDTLVMFCTPWCPHCEKLIPVLEEVGKKLEKNPEFVIGKLDMEKNDIEEMIKTTIEGFPTLVLFKAGEEKEEIVYDGAREEKGILEFLKKKAGNKAKLEGEKGREEL
ncbi:MAG: protein disulfide isomerase [Amphiamblys sp. WSBS2006]|nr:MAG: protein disulfide isomerase [Amphiamblys sp. WSBS2006]